jgi:hypothetical protein
MGTIYDEDDFDDYDTDSGSDLVKQLRKAAKAAERKAAALEQELSSLRGEARTRTVKEVLASRGINPKVAKFLPADIEPTEEAVAAWISEYADVFGVQTSEAGSEPQMKADPADVAAQARINNMVANATTPSGDDDILARINSATSSRELDQIIFGR